MLRALLIVSILANASGPRLRTDILQPIRPTTTSELARSSEFVGFIRGFPLSEDARAAWRQWVAVIEVDALKGDLGPGVGTYRYPYVRADCPSCTDYPTWFGGLGEYLVFLHRETEQGKTAWVTTAAFEIEYRPDAAGQIAGWLNGDGRTGPPMAAVAIGSLLRQLISGATVRLDTERDLDLSIRAGASSRMAPAAREPPTFERRFQHIEQLAVAIKPGTLRADVEKVFPLQDGGLSFPTGTRYYAGSEVMIEVPYDQTGGAWKPQNRVTGPLKVYRSRMHVDH